MASLWFARRNDVRFTPTHELRRNREDDNDFLNNLISRLKSADPLAFLYF